MNIKYNIYMSIYRAIKRNGKSRWEKVLGYTIKEMKKYLESKFQEKMTWDNYGKFWGIKWYIPHRFYKNSEVEKAWALKNCYPEYLTKIKKNNIFNFEDIKKYNLYDILPMGKLPFKINIEEK